MNSIREKRESIIHVQNVFLVNPIRIYLNRETEKYVIGYELKRYRVHYLTYKISKELINKSENQIIANMNVDINIREDFRYALKRTDPGDNSIMKTVIVRIIPTRYSELPPIYGTIFQFTWRKTGAGGVDQLDYEISECPTISNSTTINTVCYKKIGSQVSFGGTHGTHTYIVLSSERGRYRIGQWVKISNVSKSGRQYKYVDPITVSL